MAGQAEEHLAAGAGGEVPGPPGQHRDLHVVSRGDPSQRLLQRVHHGDGEGVGARFVLHADEGHAAFHLAGDRR
jgi:hypothetical protein